MILLIILICAGFVKKNCRGLVSKSYLRLGKGDQTQLYSNVRWHIYKLQEVSKQLKALYYLQFILTIACFMFPVPGAQRYSNERWYVYKLQDRPNS